MTQSAFDGDEILTDFLLDYIDQTLDPSERDVFKEFLSQNPDENLFARRAKEGKRILSRFARKHKARAGFEARLALRIAQDTKSKSGKAIRV